METQMNPTPQLFDETYLKCARQTPAVSVRPESAQVDIPQKTLRCIWDEQLFKSQIMTTAQGEALQVVFPGHWNFGPGPDFKNAAIRIGDRTVEGDVEIHVYREDSDETGDAEDFENVILHVYMWEGKTSPRENAESAVHELEIKNHLTQGILELTEVLDFDSYPVLNQYQFGRCHKPLARLSEEKLTRLLDTAGDARMFTKMERFADRVIAHGYEQTFYEGVAEALGYPADKKPFQILTQALPLDTLHKAFPPRLKKADRVLLAQALLFGVAGLIDFATTDSGALSAEDRKYFKKIAALWEKVRPQAPTGVLKKTDWTFGGIRPANFPYRRIAALAHWVVGHEKNGLFADWTKALQAVMEQPGNKGLSVRTANALSDFFCLDVADYWADHYSPGGKKLAKPQQLVGPARSREVVVNIGVPVGLLYARASQSEALEAALNWLLSTGKRASDNKLMRFMRHYIFGNQVKMLKSIRNDKHTQGLIQLYQDFCTQNENNCLSCTFPDVIHKNFA